MAGKTYTPALLKQGGLQIPAGGYQSAVLDCSVDNISSSAVWQALSIPAGYMVKNVGIVCLTAEGGTLTVDIGLTGGDVDGFIDGFDGNVVSGMDQSAGSAYAFAGGSYFASADTIDVLFNNKAVAAKLLVFADFAKIA